MNPRYLTFSHQTISRSSEVSKLLHGCLYREPNLMQVTQVSDTQHRTVQRLFFIVSLLINFLLKLTLSAVDSEAQPAPVYCRFATCHSALRSVGSHGH